MQLLDSAEYHARRQQLVEDLSADAVVIVAAAPVQWRNGDVEQDYRQDSNFYYLTGFAEPHALLVLRRRHGQLETILFCRPRDKQQELWQGRRLGVINAPVVLHLDRAQPISEMDAQMPALLDGASSVHISFLHHDLQQQLQGWLIQLRNQVRTGAECPTLIMDLDAVLHEARLFKSVAEVQQMQTAADLSVRAHKRAMQACNAGLMEYQLAAEIAHEFAMGGSVRTAYSSIVAGGENGCILHYTANNCALSDGDLVLIDAGCELDYYAADITRTFPVNGRFSESQRAIYQLVLDAHQASLAQAAAGVPVRHLQDTAIQVITTGLVQLGLLQGEVEKLIKNQAYQRFYMHNIGHWLGMDVHDVGRYKLAGEWRSLQVGMVMTIEPGIYIQPDDASVAPQWRGIAVRIEDDILITADGHRNLTAELPVTIAAIEALMAQA
jgi:Xaa-Pro aminopeptidase